jgi:hypothetical protein
MPADGNCRLSAVFDAVARQIVPLLLRRLELHPHSPLDILLCVNFTQAAEKFRQSIRRACPMEKVDELLAYTGIVETLVIRICPQLGAEIRQREPLKVLTNGYPTLHVDRKAFKVNFRCFLRFVLWMTCGRKRCERSILIIWHRQLWRITEL